MSFFLVLILTTFFHFCVGFGFHHYRLLATSPLGEINPHIDTLQTSQYRHGKENINIPIMWSKYVYWRRRRNSNRERTLQSIRNAVGRNHHLLKKRPFHYSPYLIKLRNDNAKKLLADSNLNHEINYKNDIALHGGNKNKEIPSTEKVNEPPNVIDLAEGQTPVHSSNPQGHDDSEGYANDGSGCNSHSEKHNKGLSNGQRYGNGDANKNHQLQFPKEKMKFTPVNTRHEDLFDKMNDAKIIDDDFDNNSGFYVNTKEESFDQSKTPKSIRDFNKHFKLISSEKIPRDKFQNDQKSSEETDDTPKPVYTDSLKVHGVYLPNMIDGRNQLRNMAIDLNGDISDTFQDPSRSPSIQNSPSLRSDQLNDQKYNGEEFGRVQSNFGYQNYMDTPGDKKMYIDAPKGRYFSGFGNFIYPDYGFPTETTGYEPLDDTSAIQSWGSSALEPGFHIVQGPGEFNSDESGCDGIETRRCSDDYECSCYGLYVCIAEKCSTRSFSSDVTEGSDGEGTFMDFPAPIEER